jgi:hypothetical protein
LHAGRHGYEISWKHCSVGAVWPLTFDSIPVTLGVHRFTRAAANDFSEF